MKEELRFQQEVTAELQADKARVDQENKLLRRDLDLANDKVWSQPTYSIAAYFPRPVSSSLAHA